MAYQHKKSKAIDRSTIWLPWTWDNRGYWYSSRSGPTGEVEYDYRYPEGASQDHNTTPRTSVTPSYDTVAVSSNYKAESNTFYTASNGYSTDPDRAPMYPTAQTTGSSYYSPESAIVAPTTSFSPLSVSSALSPQISFSPVPYNAPAGASVANSGYASTQGYTGNQSQDLTSQFQSMKLGLSAPAATSSMPLLNYFLEKYSK